MTTFWQRPSLGTGLGFAGTSPNVKLRPVRRAQKKKIKLHHWELEIMEVVAITLAILGLIAVFCIFFIRRHVIEYHLEHTYGVNDPEFFGSALALYNPLPVEGNKIELLQDGDAYFPAMLAAIRGAKKTINFQAYIVYSDEVGLDFSRCFDRTGTCRRRSADLARWHRLRLETEQLRRSHDEGGGLQVCLLSPNAFVAD